MYIVKHSGGFTQIFVQYLFFDMVQVSKTLWTSTLWQFTCPWASINSCYFYTPAFMTGDNNRDYNNLMWLT